MVGQNEYEHIETFLLLNSSSLKPYLDLVITSVHPLLEKLNGYVTTLISMLQFVLHI